MMYHQTASKKKKEGRMDGRTVGSDLEHDVVVENAHEFLGIVEQLVERQARELSKRAPRRICWQKQRVESSDEIDRERDWNSVA